ncbi:hypothetical protein MNEG_2077 [Monoraphidium neglectum]|uniref:Uncharacterized protein n=1 Tax=Monoraphidium neglectum TaxID=145388 RepID=A0A0D2MTI7_9CHLO|nr:hypothetical protein MNEG_2077 [Monoraphidium neglectum]KIZ05885.1 hypothetical protein MNEG_2077 [Monoraphidium neglectum]|eukprot:XP_013904904.1 hypothetical protein MNEG_2077 [Monoraphidium neglectum]
MAVHTVLGKVATTLPGADAAQGTSEWSRAVSAPAVLVAEAVGAALDDRLKWIRYKAAVAEVRRG